MKATHRRIEDGEICAICEENFYEDQPYPKACEHCGGDGVLQKDAERTPEDDCHEHDRKEWRDGR